MRVIRVASLILMQLAVGLAPAMAQAPGARPPGGPAAAGAGEVRGTVVDSGTKIGIGAASVAVWSRADSALVAGAIANPDGSFRIDGLRPGRYALRVSMIGYTTLWTQDVTITGASPRMNAGVIALAAAPIALVSVEANAERAVVIAPDRNSYRAKDVAPAATNASEVLETVPALEVDADGKLSLRGNENVVVQINGRPTPIRGAQLGAYLRQMPANTIERVEVVPNPSAKQDPEGMAGIVNIVLKQNVDLGSSGGVTATTSTADRHSFSANYGQQSGPWMMSLSYGFNDDSRSVVGLNDRTRLNGGAPLSYTEQDMAGTNAMRGHNVNGAVDYKLNRRDLLTATAMFNRRGQNEDMETDYTYLDGDRSLVDRFDRIRDARNRSWMADASLGFRRQFEPQRHEVTAELRFNHQDDDERSLQWRAQEAVAAT